MTNKAAKFVMNMGENMVKAKGMSNTDLADALVDVWKELDMSSIESALIHESIARLCGLGEHSLEARD